MRVLWAVAVMLALTACSKEPDFDERYDKASAEIDARVKALDAAVMEGDAVEAEGAGSATAQPLMKLHLPVAGLEASASASSGE
jgi:hypothetical protein